MKLHNAFPFKRRMYASRQTICSCLMFFLAISTVMCAQDVGTNDADLLDAFVKAKGYSPYIVFDDSNIKQFWIDKSVISRKGYFSVYNMSAYSSPNNLLKIQLANVNETQDCKIEMITETPDVDFSILNSQSRTISNSVQEDDFIKFHVFSSVFHLEDTTDNAFFVKYTAPLTEIKIKKMILSFSTNKESSYLTTPGKLVFNPDNFKPRTGTNINKVSDNSFEATGKRSSLFFTKKFLVSDQSLELSIKVKNIGEEATTFFLGYAAHTKDKKQLSGANYPYKDTNKILSVISSADNSDKIIVDSLPEWRKGCCLAINAKEDMSDIPECSLIDGTVLEIKQLDNGQAEITLSKTLAKALEKDTKIRIHGATGAYLYTNTITLQPGQEETFTSTIAKDDSFLEYSPKAFSRGVYYVVPLILSYSRNSSKENTILISDFQISY